MTGLKNAETDLTSYLRHLEESLMPGGEKNIDELSLLIADDFIEFGSSGKIYDKIGTLAQINKDSDAIIEIRDFKTSYISNDVVLATYVSVINKRGSYNSALRSSIWSCREGKWQIIFHQGTVNPER